VILYLVCLFVCFIMNQMPLWNDGILKLMCTDVAYIITNNTVELNLNLILTF
jgi:hypothetical protein